MTYGFCAAISLMLTGCAATIYGMPEEQFYLLPLEQQQVVIESYNRRMIVEEPVPHAEVIVAPAPVVVEEHPRFIPGYRAAHCRERDAYGACREERIRH